MQALQESGGAIALAAGGTFCLALTAMGKVIVWGKIGGPAGQRGSRPAVAEVMGLPPITSIAAGQSHALMSDGERVWALGRSAHMLGGPLFSCCVFHTQKSDFLVPYFQDVQNPTKLACVPVAEGRTACTCYVANMSSVPYLNSGIFCCGNT